MVSKLEQSIYATGENRLPEQRERFPRNTKIETNETRVISLRIYLVLQWEDLKRKKLQKFIISEIISITQMADSERLLQELLHKVINKIKKKQL